MNSYDIQTILNIKPLEGSKVNCDTVIANGDTVFFQAALVEDPFTKEIIVLSVPKAKAPRGYERVYRYGMAYVLRECDKLRANFDIVPTELLELEEKGYKAIDELRREYNDPNIFSPAQVCEFEGKCRPIVTRQYNEYQKAINELSGTCTSMQTQNSGE